MAPNEQTTVTTEPRTTTRQNSAVGWTLNGAITFIFRGPLESAWTTRRRTFPTPTRPRPHARPANTWSSVLGVVMCQSATSQLRRSATFRETIEGCWKHGGGWRLYKFRLSQRGYSSGSNGVSFVNWRLVGTRIIREDVLPLFARRRRRRNPYLVSIYYCRVPLAWSSFFFDVSTSHISCQPWCLEWFCCPSKAVSNKKKYRILWAVLGSCSSKEYWGSKKVYVRCLLVGGTGSRAVD